MIRGIEFLRTESYDRFLYDMFQNIPLEKYDLYIRDIDIAMGNESIKDIELPECMRGEDFLKAVDEKSYLTIFIDITAYPKGTQKEELEVYEDFLDSKCEIVFLVCDVEYVEIYTKDDDILHQFAKNAEKVGCKDLMMKTAENDGRTRLSVW